MDLSPEDAKLVTLARSSRARTNAEHGAAVRDQDGRTYVASTVILPSLHVDALDLAVAMAVSSGATGIEAAALVGEMRPSRSSAAPRCATCRATASASTSPIPPAPSSGSRPHEG